MSDYIKRETILNHYKKCSFAMVKAVIAYIEDIPAADVAPVVRCKDCAWYENGKDYVPYCDNPCSELQHPNDETFCSYGERRDDDGRGSD